MIVKMKEPFTPEEDLMNETHIIFTFSHTIPERKLFKALLESGVIGIAHKTTELHDGTFPRAFSATQRVTYR